MAAIKCFRQKVTAQIDALCSEKIRVRNHSVVYKTIAVELNRLAGSRAESRVCLIYSDLMDNNSEAGDFYAATIAAAIRNHTQGMEDRLEKLLPLASLNGIRVIIVYKPGSYHAEQQFDPCRGISWTRRARLCLSTNLIQ